MNGFVPILVAVLLAEFGPRALPYARTAGRAAVAVVMIAAIVAAAVAGHYVAPGLTGWADALMIAVALIFAAVGQVQRVAPVTGFVPVVASFWRGGTPLLAFAFAARFGLIATIAGAVCGVVAAVITSSIADEAPVPVAPIRTGSAVILALAAGIVAVQALRLV